MMDIASEFSLVDTRAATLATVVFTARNSHQHRSRSKP